MVLLLLNSRKLPMFNRIHHIAIICSDYERSKIFYVDVLGFKILGEVYRAERKSYKLDLAVNDVYQIELFSFENPPNRPSRPEAVGLRHLAFEVNDVEETILKLNRNGVICEPIRIDEFTGKKFSFFSDPDGLPLEIYER
jgi:glyoxylase I family protein